MTPDDKLREECDALYEEATRFAVEAAESRGYLAGLQWAETRAGFAHQVFIKALRAEIERVKEGRWVLLERGFTPRATETTGP